MTYLKISKKSMIKLIETIKAFSKIAGCKINVQNLSAFIYKYNCQLGELIIEKKHHLQQNQKKYFLMNKMN